ncbi:MAG: cytochrome P450 [Aliidongia sp.]
MLNHVPPALPGNKFTGHIIPFVRNPTDFLRKATEAMGSIFAIKLMGKNFVVLVGPEYHKFFFSETDKSLDMHSTYKPIAAALGKIAFGVSEEVHSDQRPLVTKFFKASQMSQNAAIIQLETQECLDGLGEVGEMDIDQFFETVIKNITVHALLGKDFKNKFGKQFWKYYDILEKSVDFIIPSTLPLPKFIRGRWARRRLENILEPIVRERRAHPDLYDDIIQDLLGNNHYHTGKAIPDDDYIGMFMGLIYAGYKPTIGPAAWSIVDLLNNPEYLKLVEQEVAENTTPNQPITLTEASSFRHAKWAVQESLRLHPPSELLLREAKTDIELGQYRVPKGWRVMLSVRLSQRDPALFRDPVRYDPLRFGPDREEGAGNRYSLVHFGADYHRCPGIHFANLEITLMMALLVQQFELELKHEVLGPGLGFETERPKRAIIRYRRKKMSNTVPHKAVDTMKASCPHLHAM